MAYEYKKLSEVTTIDAVDSAVNLLIEQNDEIKKVNVDKLPIPTHTQADWNEEDETKASFIKNKPDLSQVGGGSGGSGVEVVVISLDYYGSILSRPSVAELKEKLDSGAIVYIETYYSGYYTNVDVYPRSLVVGYYYTPECNPSGSLLPETIRLCYFNIMGNGSQPTLNTLTIEG